MNKITFLAKIYAFIYKVYLVIYDYHLFSGMNYRDFAYTLQEYLNEYDYSELIYVLSNYRSCKQYSTINFLVGLIPKMLKNINEHTFNYPLRIEDDWLYFTVKVNKADDLSIEDINKKIYNLYSSEVLQIIKEIYSSFYGYRLYSAKVNLSLGVGQSMSQHGLISISIFKSLIYQLLNHLKIEGVSILSTSFQDSNLNSRIRSKFHVSLTNLVRKKVEYINTTLLKDEQISLEYFN